MNDERDTTVTKVDSRFSPRGPDGQVSLASGTSVAMRMWADQPAGEGAVTVREYETVGYVLAGRARLELEGQAVVATRPPVHAHGRDDSADGRTVAP